MIISIEEMMPTPAAVDLLASAVKFPHVNLSDLPVRGKSVPSTARNVSIETKLDLLKKLVERVKDLDHVSVKNVPYLSKSGVVVEIPGPWSLRLSGSSTPARHSLSAEDLEEPVDDGEEEDEDEGEVLESTEEVDQMTQLLMQLNREKFVVRNEFGHVRLSHLLDAMESYPYHPLSERVASQLEIGGHCVLSEEDFFTCIAKGWGEPHPLAGRFHPIAGTMIPETTLLFYVPRNDTELDLVWEIIQSSHAWALSAQNKKER